jgi:hypothetical protein
MCLERKMRVLGLCFEKDSWFGTLTEAAVPETVQELEDE